MRLEEKVRPCQVVDHLSVVFLEVGPTTPVLGWVQLLDYNKVPYIVWLGASC